MNWLNKSILPLATSVLLSPKSVRLIKVSSKDVKMISSREKKKLMRNVDK